MNIDFNHYLTVAGEQLTLYAPKILLALITLWVGLKIVGFVTSILKKNLETKNIDASLRTFVVSLLGILLKLMVFISVASQLGIETTSFVAVLGAAGLAVGLALQGSLANFAGSVLLLIFRPFQVGDLIETDGRVGTVKDIQIFCTILKTLDNKTVIIPNGPLSSGTIVNLSTEQVRRIDLTFGIGYNDDIKQAKEIMARVMKEDSRILDEPAPQVAVSELADSSVNFVFRPWVNKEDFWDVYFDCVETVKYEFDKAGISIPFPQQDIHIHGLDASKVVSRDSSPTVNA